MDLIRFTIWRSSILARQPHGLGDGLRELVNPRGRGSPWRAEPGLVVSRPGGSWSDTVGPFPIMEAALDRLWASLKKPASAQPRLSRLAANRSVGKPLHPGLVAVALIGFVLGGVSSWPGLVASVMAVVLVVAATCVVKVNRPDRDPLAEDR